MLVKKLKYCTSLHINVYKYKFIYAYQKNYSLYWQKLTYFSKMGLNKISENMTGRKICCCMLVLWYHLDKGFFSRLAEKEPVSDCSHHNIKANIMKTVIHLWIRAEWNSKALQFGTFTFFSSLNEVPNIRETYFFSLLIFFKMELYKLENIWWATLPFNMACQKAVEFHWILSNFFLYIIYTHTHFFVLSSSRGTCPQGFNLLDAVPILWQHRDMAGRRLYYRIMPITKSKQT